MKITNREAEAMLNSLGLSAEIKISGENKFSYAWGKNHNKLLSINRHINNNHFPKEDEEQRKMQKECAKIEPKLLKEGFVKDSPEYKEKYAEMADAVEAQFPHVKEKFETHNEWFENEFMETEIDFEPYMLTDITSMPEMTLEQRAGCNFFLPE